MPKAGGGSGKASGAAEGTDIELDPAGNPMRALEPGTSQGNVVGQREVQVAALQNASETGAPFCEVCEQKKDAEEAAARAQEDAANAGKSPAQHAQDQIDLATGTPGAGSGQTGGPGIGHEATHTVQQGSSGQSSKPPKSS